VSRYNGPANDIDVPRAMTISPDGGEVLVTGVSAGTDNPDDAATVAYGTSTGKRLWVRRYNDAWADAVAASPDESKLFVSGNTVNGGNDADWITIAYGVP